MSVVGFEHKSIVGNYKRILYFKHPEYSVWKEAYDFYCSLLKDEDLQQDTVTVKLISELGSVLISTYTSWGQTHLDSEILSDEEKEELTIYKKRIINDVDYIKFSGIVKEKVRLMSGGIIEYPLWFTYYTQYKYLRERAIKESYEGFDLLADKFGHVLLDVEVVPLIPDEEGLIKTYKSEIKKDLAASKKYEDK